MRVQKYNILLTWQKVWRFFRGLRLYVAKEFGTVEVGIGDFDGVPGEEVWRAKVVAALVEVGAEVEALDALDVVLEIDAVRHEENYLPADAVGTADVLGEVLAAEARPALDALEHFGRSEGAGVAILAGSDEDGADAVALNIIIYTIGSRAREKFYAGVFPHVTAVAVGNGSDALFRHAVVDDETTVGGYDAELDVGAVGVFCPVDGVDGVEGYALLVEPCGKGFEGEGGESEVVKFESFHDGFVVL